MDLAGLVGSSTMTSGRKRWGGGGGVEAALSGRRRWGEGDVEIRGDGVEATPSRRT
jgi:hypothetical protein